MSKLTKAIMGAMLSFILIFSSSNVHASTTPKMVKLSSKALHASILVPNEIASKIYTRDIGKTWAFYYKDGKKSLHIMGIGKAGGNFNFFEDIMNDAKLIKYRDDTKDKKDLVAEYMGDMPYNNGTKQYKDNIFLNQELLKYLVTYEESTKHSPYKYVKFRNYQGTWANQSNSKDKIYDAVSLQFISDSKANVVISSKRGSSIQSEGKAVVIFNKNGITSFDFKNNRANEQGNGTLFLSNNRVYLNITPYYKKSNSMIMGNRSFTKKVSKIPVTYP